MPSKESNSKNVIHVDPLYLIRLATHDKMSWNILEMLLEDLISTLAKSKQVIKLLLQELQDLHSKLKLKQVSIKEVETDKIDSEMNDLEDQNVLESSEEDGVKLDPICDGNDSRNQEIEPNPFAIVRFGNENEVIEDEDFIEDKTKIEYVKDCLVCGERFLTIIDYENHETIHEDCDDVESRKVTELENNDNSNVDKQVEDNLPQGMEIIESCYKNENTLSKRKHFECKICCQLFYNQKDLKRHETIHTGEKSFQCQICKKKFATSRNLNKHEIVHTDKKPHQCRTCLKSFRQKQSLKIHELLHSGEKPYKCKTCPKSFVQLDGLKTHMMIHTGEKPFQCKYCDKSYTQSGNLKMHEMFHTGTKPFECKTCKKSFSLLSDLKVHKRVHTGEKPFQCKYCSKSFSQISHLKPHERVHTGEKPFQCKSCNKMFKLAQQLNKI